MHTFYFEFQQYYIAYVLKGYNTPSQCFMGLHGHILDFTGFAPYHPGLSEPIVVECGRDVTRLFEEIRHSRTARRIGRKLCVIIDKSCCIVAATNKKGESNHLGFGLQRVQLSNEKKKKKNLVRNNNNTSSSWSFSDSNSRPPPSDTKENFATETIFPKEMLTQPRRSYTLQKFRTQFDNTAKQKQTEIALPQKQSSFSSFAASSIAFLQRSSSSDTIGTTSSSSSSSLVGRQEH
mmetsp:Transcript_15027/g.17264  ORF Transcript_15027/g.17264 Transcript_15027/m.17264 type:complete len:235 (-) Transcript_15027:39-743(-)